MQRGGPSALERAFDAASARFDGGNFERLAERDRVLLAVWWLEGDVNNGGFDQYFRNSSGDLANFASRALRRIGADAMASIAEEANAEFGPGGPPGDRDERTRRLLAMTDEQRARLDALDRRFYAYPDDVSRLLCAFLGIESRSFAVRLATLDDAGVIARHRIAMFTAMGSIVAGSDETRRIEDATRRMLAETMPAGEWVAWIAEDGGAVLGSGAALLRRLAPRAGHPEGGTEAYLLNFFTEPRARRRGVATAVMEACLAWCAGRGIARITLHASDAGRLVYAPLGFVPRDGEMVWGPPPR